MQQQSNQINSNAKIHQQTSFSNDDRPIQAKGSYTLPDPDEFDMQDNNYQIVDDLSEKQVAESDSGLMAKVYGGIKSMLDKVAAKKSKDSSTDFEESKDDSSPSLGQDRGPNWTEQKKEELRG